MKNVTSIPQHDKEPSKLAADTGFNVATASHGCGYTYSQQYVSQLLDSSVKPNILSNQCEFYYDEFATLSEKRQTIFEEFFRYNNSVTTASFTGSSRKLIYLIEEARCYFLKKCPSSLYKVVSIEIFLLEHALEILESVLDGQMTISSFQSKLKHMVSQYKPFLKVEENESNAKNEQDSILNSKKYLDVNRNWEAVKLSSANKSIDKSVFDKNMSFLLDSLNNITRKYAAISDYNNKRIFSTNVKPKVLIQNDNDEPTQYSNDQKQPSTGITSDEGQELKTRSEIAAFIVEDSGKTDVRKTLLKENHDLKQQLNVLLKQKKLLQERAGTLKNFKSMQRLFDASKRMAQIVLERQLQLEALEDNYFKLCKYATATTTNSLSESVLAKVRSLERSKGIDLPKHTSLINRNELYHNLR